MRKIVFLSFTFLFASLFAAAQQNDNFSIYGTIPDISDTCIYQIQVGSFLLTTNAQNAYRILDRAGLNPVYEKYRDFTRVLIKGINANNVLSVLSRIQQLGFKEALVKRDASLTVYRESDITPPADYDENLDEPLIDTEESAEDANVYYADEVLPNDEVLLDEEILPVDETNLAEDDYDYDEYDDSEDYDYEYGY